MIGNDLIEAIGGNVGIDLRRGDVGVPQKGLNDPQVCAPLQQMCREGVAKDVGAYPSRVDARANGGFVQHLGEATGCQVTRRPCGREQPGAFLHWLGPSGIAGDEPCLYRASRRRVEWGQPFLSALPEA